MLSRSASLLRSRLARTMQQLQQRTMGGGGGKYMETNNFGLQVGEVFGTIAWLWIFYRFSQDGKVLLGYEHPWEHGGHGDHGGHSGGHSHKAMTADERAASWEVFADRAIKPGDDDDDDEDDDDEDEDDEE